MNNYTATVDKSGTWYAGFVKELPGARLQGNTIEEVTKKIERSNQAGN